MAQISVRDCSFVMQRATLVQLLGLKPCNLETMYGLVWEQSPAVLAGQGCGTRQIFDKMVWLDTVLTGFFSALNKVAGCLRLV